LGIGGGANGFMTARGSANVLTRTTAILAALFFILAIGLTVFKTVEPGSDAILETAAQTDTVETGTEETTEPANVLDALNMLQEQTSGESADSATPAAGTTDTTTTTPADDSPVLAIPEASTSTETGGN
jgi:preprotein translocase subunit SecG